VSLRLEEVDREKMLRAALDVMSDYRKLYRPLWSIVGDVCCVGSTSAKRICRELGWDPDADAKAELPRRTP
jgi:hypothetical protein